MSETPIEARIIPPAGDHGDDIGRVAAALGIEPGAILDLAQTLNPVADDITTLARTHLDSLRRYPDPTRLTTALAAVLGCDVTRVVLTNGGAEAIALVATHVQSGWVDEPDFALYRRHLRSLDPNAGRWRSNPHSPTGVLADPAEHAAVWDEAFWPLTTGTWSRGDADRGAIVVGSLTKLYACPGLRVGYVVAPDGPTATAIRAHQPRWSVNSLAADLLPELLASTDLATWASSVRGLHTEFADELRRRGLDVSAADAPWLLVRRPGLRRELAQRAILVRDCTSFGLDDTVRIATPRADDLSRLLDAIDRILEGSGANS